jgi:hypothetical protein
VKLCDGELGTMPFVTVTGPPTFVGVPAQLPPAKYSYCTDPPAPDDAPVRVAPSVIGCPVGTLVTESVVASVGAVLPTEKENVPELP